MTDGTPTTHAATVVLVHGAFADGSSWSGVIERLRAKAVPVTAPAEPAARHLGRTPRISRPFSRRSMGPCWPSVTRTAAP